MDDLEDLEILHFEVSLASAANEELNNPTAVTLEIRMALRMAKNIIFFNKLAITILLKKE